MLSRAQLEERLYGWGEEVESNAVEVHIHNLRKKLGADYIQNVRGVGYKVRAACMRTIRARLLVWLLSAVVAAGLSSAYTLYEAALTGADQVFDEQLQQTAFSLRDQSFEFALPPQLPPAQTRNNVVVQVWRATGVRVYFSELYRKLLPELPGLQQPGFSNVTIGKVSWRVFSLPSRGYVIQVAQPLAVRQQRAVSLALQTLTPLGLMLPVLGAAIWLIVGTQLKPLDRIAESVRLRQPDALDPLPESSLPDEIQPARDRAE